MSLAGETLRTYALEGSGYVNAFRVYPASPRPAALVDVDAVLARRPRVPLGTQARVTAVSVDAGGCGRAWVGLAFVNVWEWTALVLRFLNVYRLFFYCVSDFIKRISFQLTVDRNVAGVVV